MKKDFYQKNKEAARKDGREVKKDCRKCSGKFVDDMFKPDVVNGLAFPVGDEGVIRAGGDKAPIAVALADGFAINIEGEVGARAEHS